MMVRVGTPIHSIDDTLRQHFCSALSSADVMCGAIAAETGLRALTTRSIEWNDDFC